MRRFPLGFACGALVGLAACGDTQVIGTECLSGGACALQNSGGDDCSAEFTLDGLASTPDADRVAPGAELTRCGVFTLGTAGSGQVYLKELDPQMLPFNHQLDIAIAREAPGIADGWHDCAEIQSHQIAWVPLIATEGSTMANMRTFADAPIASDATLRILMSDRIFNGSKSQTIGVSARLQIKCSRVRPLTVRQIFEFERRTPYVVGPGEAYTVSGSCPFQHDATISNLGHPIESTLTEYSVSIDLGAPQCTLVSTTDCPVVKHAEWSAALIPYNSVRAEHTVDWRCTYENRSDVALDVGGNASTTCSLFGLYSRSDGGEDEIAEHCELP